MEKIYLNLLKITLINSLLTLFLISSSSILCQEFNYKYLSTDNSGLLDNGITNLIEDKQGNKWIGTIRGVSRFDGKNWKNWYRFFSPSNLADSSFIVHGMDIDSKNNKWIASTNGLFKIDANDELSLIKEGVFLSVAVDLKDKLWLGRYNSLMTYDGITMDSITDDEPLYFYALPMNIKVDKNNTKWVGIYQQSSGKGLLKITDSIKEKILLPKYTTQIQTLKIDRFNSIWIGTENEGIYKYDGKTWVNYSTQNSGIISDNVQSLEIENDSIVWIGTNIGLSRFNGSNWQNFGINSLLNGNITNAILKTKNNELWVGSYSGITILSEKKCDTLIVNPILAGTTQICEGSYLDLSPSNTNFEIFRWDWKENGNEYVSNEKTIHNNTFTPGEYEFTLRSIDKNGCVMPTSKISVIVRALPKVSILNGDSIIYRTAANIQLVGSPNGGIFSGEGITNNTLFPSKTSLGFKELLYQWADSFGCVGNKSKVIEIVDSTKNQSTENLLHFNTSNSGLKDNTINCIKFDKNSNCWVGTNKGLSKFDGTKWETYTTSNSSILSDTINSVDTDNSGSIWVATQKGITTISKDDKWNNLPSLNSTNYSLVIDKFDTKWIGSKNGLFRITNDSITLFNQGNSTLKSQEITSLSANANYIMIGTTFGLYSFNIDGGYFDYEYGTSSYTTLADSKINAAKIDLNNTIWIGTDNGLNKITNYLELSGNIYLSNLYETFTHSNSGLMNDTVIALNFVDSNLLLVGTKNGLTIYNGNKWETILIQKRSVVDFEVISTAIDNNGAIWFGTSNGLYKIHNDKSTGLTAKPENSISAYPNPTNNKITIDHLNKNTQIRITDILGNLLFDKTFQEDKIEIELNQLAPKGMYFIQAIQNERTLKSFKVILN